MRVNRHYLASALFLLTLSFLPGQALAARDATSVSWDNPLGYQHQSRIHNIGVHQSMLNEALTAYSQDRFDEARNKLEFLAGAGHRDAQYHLGTMFYHGLGVERSIPDAIFWYHSAAEAGQEKAQYNLGVAYSRGVGVKNDLSEAINWWKRAANNGNKDAQFNLGLIYSRGMGVKTNHGEAVLWWHKAAMQGDPAAQFNLGMMYANGHGVEQDFEVAFSWWRKSAKQGFDRAIRALASYSLVQK